MNKKTPRPAGVALRPKRIYITAILAFLILSAGCDKQDVTVPTKPDLSDPSIALQWASMSLNTLRQGKNTPTYSSRSLGYLGLTMYECVVHSNPSYRSLQGQLNGLGSLPRPEAGADYEWRLVLNSGMHTMIKLLYPSNNNITIEVERTIDTLYQLNMSQHGDGVSADIIDRSVQFGRAIAISLFEWAKADGGDLSYLTPFDQNFPFPSGDSYWIPPLKGQTISKYPLHPHWGDHRTFSLANSELPVPGIKQYSTDPQSNYYADYLEIYNLSKNLTRTDKEIAAWWADDPTETVSPPGHSFNLASLAIRKSRPDLVKAAETYARVGMAVADAFICCFKTKYTYFNERPSTYISKIIDTAWAPFWPEPPFPAFPSGHSTQSAATAEVLTSLYGENYSFIDDTHAGAVRFPFAEPMQPRSYNSFWQSAEETGYSRLLGGIHTRQDNETGLAEGRKIGNNINTLIWKN